MAKKDNNFTAQNEKAKFSHAIRKASRILKPLHLDYDQTKYIFKEIRKALGVRDERKPSRIVESLSIAKVELLINTAYKFKGHIGLAIKVLFMTGARNDEFVNIEIGDVLIDECFIHIRKAKGGKHAHRYVPILPVLAQELNTYIKSLGRNRGYLFETNRHDKYSNRRLQQIIRKIAETAGVNKRVYPHLLRHSIAQLLYDWGMPEERIQMFLGHNDRKTTQIYAKSSRKHVKESYYKAFFPHPSISQSE